MQQAEGKVVIHSDGACRGNPGPGGWAAVIRYGAATKEISGGEPETTNNRMELTAAIEALRALARPGLDVEFYTDSAYLRSGITAWLPAWKARGWRTADNRPVKNADLWRELDGLASRHNITWHWVRGHNGTADNERSDRLARLEVRKLGRTARQAAAE